MTIPKISCNCCNKFLETVQRNYCLYRRYDTEIDWATLCEDCENKMLKELTKTVLKYTKIELPGKVMSLESHKDNKVYVFKFTNIVDNLKKCRQISANLLKKVKSLSLK